MKPDYHRIKPDDAGYCVYYFQHGKRGVQQKFFKRGHFGDAINYANDLVLDDRFYKVQIVEHCHYYFDKVRSYFEENKEEVLDK